ncbi:MAG: DUF1573 domain-containing protein [Patescibacteria group bacterium]|jgi:hypothetical protein
MSSKVIITLCVFFGVMLGLVFFITTGQKPDLASIVYSAQDTNRPKVEANSVFKNLGEISVSDVKKQDFSFKNTGTKPLQILGISSSCGCTTGQLIYKGTTTKPYSMHAQSGFITNIAPGESAIVRLVYRPATMPVYGLVEREVYVTTNDPLNQKLVFSIKAKVR